MKKPASALGPAAQSKNESRLVTIKVTALTLKLAKLIAALNDEKLYEVLERAVGRELLQVAPEVRKALRISWKTARKADK